MTNNTDILVELNTPNGPKVTAPVHVEAEEILANLPEGWTVHDSDWGSGVPVSGGMAYPLCRVTNTQKYTYTIFDSNPQTSSGCAWPTHSDVALDADSDDEAVTDVSLEMCSEAAGLNAADGYDVGDKLYALVWDADGIIVGSPTYEITAEDLGIEEEEEVADEASAVGNVTDKNVSEWIADLSFRTPPENQGQIVIVSYACDSDYIYERTYDQSDCATSVSVYEHPTDDSEFEPWNGTPSTGDLVGTVQLA